MEVRLVSALNKIFSDDASFPPEQKRLTLFAGERANLQLCLCTDRAAELRISVASPLPLKTWLVKEVYCSKPMYEDAVCCTLLRDTVGDYPDLLSPFSGTLTTEAGKKYAVWIELDPAGFPAGEYAVQCTVSCGAVAKTVTAGIRVGETALAENTLLYTDWFHSDCLSTYYGVPVFSEEYWRIVENFMKNAAAHGMTCILTPLFTPPLDTAVGAERPTVQLVGVTETPEGWAFDFSLLERWMALAERCGITHFEFSHLFTQWGALAAPKVIAATPEGIRRVFGWETDSLSPEYRGFLTALGKALTAFTDARGCTERCLVHCSDEPGEEHIPRYAQCAALVHDAFGAYRHLDALSHFEFFEQGNVQIPVPGEGSVDRFAGRVPALWTYYCCGQFNDELPNRFIAMPSVRNRILGTLLYKYNCEGFLHWGYNFYYSQLSKFEIDPFTDTSSGAAFPSGDAFFVYPGPDGEPMPALRQKVFFDGLQDLMALRAAEQRLGRETVLALIKDTLGEIDFSHYPMDEETFFRFRDALWQAVND